jgi:8-oxo-dGTP diphosphatase
MVNHTGLTDGSFWAPPGGGVDFGVSAQDTLVREFQEETGLMVVPGVFLFATERVRIPLHAIELFFSVQVVGGTLRVGHDPEMGSDNQIIKEVKFMTFEEIDALPTNLKHGAFGLLPKSGRIRELNGYFRI